MSYLTQAYGAAKLALQANAPTIMVVGGVVSMGVGTVLACKKTLKVEEVLKPHTTDLDKISEGTLMELRSYTDEDARSDRIKVYTRASIDLAKLYAVPGILFVAGVGLVFGGHHMLVKRNATLALAFTGLKQAFDNYRGRVRDQWGAEADQAMYGGYSVKEVIDPETNEVQTIAVRDWDASAGDPYNRIFEQGATSQWVNDLGVNKMFLHNQERFAAELLVRRGYLYLSEVYQSLGFPESDISRVVGWKVKHLHDGSRDIPAVDFGFDKPGVHPDFNYSKTNAVYLDFNCQGLIVGGKIQKILERA